MKLPDASLQVYEKTSFTHTLSCIFSGCITIASSEEVVKVCEHNFFQRKVVLLVIYLFNHDSSKSTIFMLNIAFDAGKNLFLESLFNKIRVLRVCNFIRQNADTGFSL